MTAPLRFVNRFVEQLPGDPSLENRSRPVTGALWSKVSPTAVAAPKLIAYSKELAQQLGLDESTMRDQATVNVLAGNGLWEGMAPFAANYGGHQFGHWAGQLGDGRAIVLGEAVTRNGDRLELQLKGAGPTPYSRRGDGRAVLRSSIREFLCSEAMYQLGVPTTRALSLVTTGDLVMRDMFYDGNAENEPGAIVCRVAPSFLRFGNFELCTSRNDIALLKTLTDFTIQNYFAHLGAPSKETYGAFFKEVAQRTAQLMAHWQAVGFVHGVMNTDNMSILGLTIDYGPYGWVDNFDPSWTPNTTDAQHRRYRFGNQPAIGLWNVERLGIALLPLIDDEEAVEAGLVAFQETFELESARRLSEKLGLSLTGDPEDFKLINDCFAWLAAEETDMTVFFRALSQVAILEAAPDVMPAAILNALYAPDTASAAHLTTGLRWLQRWWLRARKTQAVTGSHLAARLNSVNPKFVLRNWLAQEAIDSAHAGNTDAVSLLLDVMRHPFEEQPGREHFAQKRPDWARSKPGCSALSCSS